MVNRFVGKTIMVTGAAGGIGAAVARLLVAEGAFVYALDRHRSRLEAFAAQVNEEHSGLEPIVVDIARADLVEEAVSRVESRRPVDGLVNGAGVLLGSSFERTTLEDWHETFDINVHGTFHVSRSVARRMVERHAGVIVTIASNAATTPRVNLSAYCASKAAIVMLTKCMGLELAEHGIRCNVISPGSTRTRMLDQFATDSDVADQALVRGDPALYRTGIPLRKIAEPEDVARAVAFLLSQDAGHITLHDLVVDGGATL